MKKTFFLAMAIAMAFSAFSQTVLLEQYPENDTIVKKWGKNRAHFAHAYFDFGFTASGAEDGAEITYGNSINLDFGVRYKRRISNNYALGSDLSFGMYSYRLKQDEETKILPDNIEHDKEKIILSTLKLEVFQRINFGKRGNHIGRFWDLGVYGSYFVQSQHYTLDKDPELYPHIKKLEVYESSPDYIDDIEYGVVTRFGKDRWVLFARYRLSDLFIEKDYLDKDKYPELPSLQIGIELGLY